MAARKSLNLNELGYFNFLKKDLRDAVAGVDFEIYWRCVEKSYCYFAAVCGVNGSRCVQNDYAVVGR
jgi:hypothetical protein